MKNGEVRHYSRRVDEGDTNIFDNYYFTAGNQDSAINFLNFPEYSSNTFIKTTGILRQELLIDSGNSLHSPVPIDPNPVVDSIGTIKFQLSWDK